MSRNIIIAFSGWAQSGKDTAADFVEDILHEDFKYAVNVAHVERASCASPIKEVIQTICNIKETEIEDKDAPIDFTKKYFSGVAKTYRDLNILIGEAMKKIFSKNIWVYSLENKIKNMFKNTEYKNGDRVFIIPDIRYNAEFKMLDRFAKHNTEVYHFCVFRKKALPEWINVGLDPLNPDELEIIKNDFLADRSEYEWCVYNPTFADKLVNDASLQDFSNEVKEKVIKRIWKN